MGKFDLLMDTLSVDTPFGPARDVSHFFFFLVRGGGGGARVALKGSALLTLEWVRVNQTSTEHANREI